MTPALLVSEQRANWDAFAPSASAVAASDEAFTQKAEPVSASFQRAEWNFSLSPFVASSPFEYQRANPHTVWLPITKRRAPERHNPRSAQLALEQIRASHCKEESRRREQAEAEWIAVNRVRYAGQWVALLGGKLIAAGDTAREVAQAAAGQPSTPLIVYLEKELPFAGW